MQRRDLFKLFAGSAALPAVKSINSLELKPEDTIVLKFQGRLTYHDMENVSANMKRHFPGQRFLILDAGADIEVLRAR